MDCEIKFEKEDVEGIVAVGSYLSDVAHRFGIKAIGRCDLLGESHTCKVQLLNGAELLSEKTAAETKLTETNALASDERLACQAKIIEPGEISIRTFERSKPETEAEKVKDSAQDYRQNFAELPLEKKIADLVRLEAITFNETLAYIFNSPYHIGGKVMDVLAEFGLKKDAADKTAVRPDEHQDTNHDGSDLHDADDAVDDVIEAEFVSDSQERSDENKRSS